MRLVDADKMIIDTEQRWHDGEFDDCDLLAVFKAIEKAPTAKLDKKYIEGKWLFKYETTTAICYCSKCGYGGNRRFNFCPNCGARMG